MTLNVCNHGNYSDRGLPLSASESFFMHLVEQPILGISLIVKSPPNLHVETAKKPPTSAEHLQHCCSHHIDQSHGLSLTALTSSDHQPSARCVGAFRPLNKFQCNLASSLQERVKQISWNKSTSMVVFHQKNFYYMYFFPKCTSNQFYLSPFSLSFLTFLETFIPLPDPYRKPSLS